MSQQYTLSNTCLCIAVDTHGAELKSVKALAGPHAGREYMWRADGAFWGRTSPVLFPFVGMPKDKKFTVDGKDWPMGQHGFARDCDFVLASQTDDTLTFVLDSDEATRARYPFDFSLTITYQLAGTGLTVGWQVTNTGERDLPFSIGAHPAFNCPLEEGVTGVPTDCENFTGYELVFDNQAPLAYYLVDGNGNAVPETEYPLPMSGEHTADISHELFAKDALVIDHKQCSSVAIAKKGEAPFVTVTFDAPLVGIWTPTGKYAPFLCIEPWFGRADAHDFAGDLYQREYGQILAAGGSQSFSYKVDFT